LQLVLAKKILSIAGRFTLWLIISIIGLVLLLSVAIQFPYVQQKLINGVTAYVSNKTHTRFEVGKIGIGFPKNIVLQSVFAEDLQHDTLLAVHELSVGINMLELMSGDILIDEVNLNGATAHLYRTLPDSTFNFNFLIDAFAPGEKENKKEEPADTSSTAINLQVKTISLSDINLIYADAVSGLSTKAHIGRFNLDMKHIDLAKMEFKGDELLFTESNIEITIDKNSPAEIDTTTSSLLPSFAFNGIKLNNIRFTFHNKPDSFSLNTQVGLLQIGAQFIDLNKQEIKVDKLTLHQSAIAIVTQTTKTDSTTADTSSQPSNWKITVNTIDLKQNQFNYDVSNLAKQPTGMDYNHLAIGKFGLQAHTISYTTDAIKGNIKQLTLTEQCGLNLLNFHTQFIYDNKHIELANLLVQTPNTHIANHASVNYPSLNSFKDNIGIIDVNLNLKQTQIAIQDVLLFAPFIQSQEIIKRNKNQVVKLNGRVKGKLNDIHFDNIIIETAHQTAIAFSGNMSGLPDAKQLKYAFKLRSLFTTRADLKALLPDSMLPSSIAIPAQLKIAGTTSGGLQNNRSELTIHSSSGFAYVNTNVSGLNTIPVYSAQVKTNKFDIGYIIKQPLFGTVTGTIDASGKGFDVAKMRTEVAAQFDELQLNNYGYSNINFTANIDSGNYVTQLNINDSAVQLSLNADASLRNNQTNGNVFFTLTGADLKELKLSKEQIKTSGTFVAHVRQKDSNDLRGNIAISDVTVIKNNRNYKLDSLVAVSVNAKRNTSFSVDHSLIKISYKGETGLDELGGVMQQYIAQFISNKPLTPDTVSQSFTCSIQVNPHPFINEVLLPQLTKFEGLTVSADYNGRQKSLVLNLNSPLIEYQGNTVKGVAIAVNGNDKNLTYQAAVREFSSGSVSMPQTILKGSIQQHIIAYQLKIIEPDTGYKLAIAGNINLQNADKTIIHFADSAIFNNTLWHNGKQNTIVITQHGINVQNFELSHNNEYVKIQSKNINDNAPINIVFNQFELGTLSKIIENDKEVVRGLLQGNVTIQSVEKFAFTSDLDITKTVFNNVSIGDLNIKANNLNGNKYEATISLVGEQNNANLSGYFQDNKIDFALTVGQLDMQTIEAFIPQTIKQSEGYISGNVDITGDISKPVFNGEIIFNNTAFRLASINTRLQMHREKIKIDNQGIYFNQFTVLDSASQPLVINGKILTSDFKKMDLDIDISMKNFMLMRTTAAQNNVYYGTILVSSDIKVRGTDKLPIIKADVNLLEGSSFTFIIQEGELSTDKGDGIVVFTDTSQNNLMQADTLNMVAALTGLDINANIEVNKLTRFKIITDKFSGDNLDVSGNAILNFAIDPSGKMSLAGTYTLNDGNYKASFQKIVKRNFSIKKGSTIVWSGDPLDGNLNLTAVYATRTSSADLLANEMQGISNTSKKLLTYYVNLNIDGSLLKPRLSFNLDMADKDKGAENGMPYEKINAINNDVNELNRQVFSLLVLERFLPTGQSGGSATDAASSIARNSVNSLLSDQMNKLSGKYVKGAELNFNLETNDEYSGAAVKQNTELQIGLKKEMLNNRMSVQVGSNIELGNAAQQTSNQNITGDLVAEYKITDDGSYRFKAFMENQYEGIIDGTLYKQGVGILYTRDYNHINELFRPVKIKQDTTK
jgi:hypothetical protein